MKRIITLALLAFSLDAISQDMVPAPATDSSSVAVHKDPRLSLLVNKQAQVNELTSRDARKMAKGFRLLIIRTNSRDEAIAAKTKVYTYFPELKAYLWHQSPYYNVRPATSKIVRKPKHIRKK